MACIHLHKHTQVQTHTHAQAHTHTYRHTCVLSHACTYTNTHMHMYIHTCADTDTYMIRHTHLKKTSDTEIQTLTFARGQPPSLLPTPSLWEVKRILFWVLFFLWRQRIYGVPPVQRCPTFQTRGPGFHTVKNRRSWRITIRDWKNKPAKQSKSIQDWDQAITESRKSYMPLKTWT